MLNVEPSNLVFLKTYNTVFDEIIITFIEQNGRPLEKEDKVSLTLCINESRQCFTESRTRIYVKRYGFLSSVINFLNKYKKQWIWD